MKSMHAMALAAAIALLPSAASAQSFLGKSTMPTTAPKMEGQYWSPKPTKLTAYVAPNKPHWKVSEILAAHKGQTDWVQPIVRNSEQEGDYVSMGPGKKTKAKFYPDDRMIFIVQDGEIKVTIDGAEPFTAKKGFMVNVPYRHLFTLETVGDKPSLRFEVRQADEPPVYPAAEMPDAYPGRTYTKVTMTPGPQKDDATNPIYVDFFKDVAVGDKPYNDKFVWDDHFTSNILRGKGAPVPPPTNKGHFHVGWTEFWFIAEGKIGYLIEGLPYFEADQGDVVIAAKGRWHRAAFAPGSPMSTRIPLNPRPPILHNFEIVGD
jgi:quercetin dioxygenase-like cupin family protein